MMTDLVIGVVVNILRHIAVKDLQSSSVKGIASVNAGDRIILGTAELGVLLPEILFHLFEGAEETQNGDVPFCNRRTTQILTLCERSDGTAQKRGSHRCGAGCDRSVSQEGTAIRATLQQPFRLCFFHNFISL